MAHTPGPWEADFLAPDRNTLDLNIVRSSDFGWRIAAVSATNKAVGEANARLIAAAPELLGALRFILAFYEPGQRHLDTNAWKNAEAGARHAVAKAEGKIA